MVSDSIDNIVLCRPQRRTDKDVVILCTERVEYVHIWLAMTQQLGELPEELLAPCARDNDELQPCLVVTDITESMRTSRSNHGNRPRLCSEEVVPDFDLIDSLEKSEYLKLMGMHMKCGSCAGAGDFLEDRKGSSRGCRGHFDGGLDTGARHSLSCAIRNEQIRIFNTFAKPKMR